MNKIIFDDYLEKEKESEDYPKHLRMPPKEEEKEVPFMGMKELERDKGIKEVAMYNHKEPMYSDPKDFAETFKDFCFASLVY